MQLRLDVTKPVDAKPGDRRPGRPADPRRRLGHRRQARAGHPAAQPPGGQRLGRHQRQLPAVARRSAFPEHLVDCKRAIAWWREHADEHGGDPDFLCVTGGSAGGHLTALVGADRQRPAVPARLRGRRHVDARPRCRSTASTTSPTASARGTRTRVTRFIEPMVMKRSSPTIPRRSPTYSPLDRVRADAPPFLVIHGSLDTLAPVEDAREFVAAACATRVAAPVLYAEMAGRPARLRDLPELPDRPGHRGRRALPARVHRAYRRGRTDAEVGPRGRDELVDTELSRPD